MVGDRLKKARTDCGLTQKQVADLLGIERSSYTYYETGKCAPSAHTLQMLSIIFGVRIEELVYEEHPALVFHSPSVIKPTTFDIDNIRYNLLTSDERKMLAQFRLITSMGKKDELEKALSKLANVDGADDEKSK